MLRHKNGRFRRGTRITRELVMGAVLAGIVGGIFIDVLNQPYVTEVYAKEIPQEPLKEQPREVRIEVVYNWDEERVKEKIAKIFPDAPIMIKVAWCESRYDIHAFNPTNGSDDRGLLQISTLYHGKEMIRLGLDIENPEDQLLYARHLYDIQGLAPWSASRHCWQ